MHEHPLVLVAEARDQLAFVVGDEGMAVIALSGAVVVLKPDAVRRYDRYGVRHRVTLHGALPLQMGIEARILRLRADGGRVEQDLCAL